MIEVTESTGLTRITCDACAESYDTTFEATQPHQDHFDPVEEIEWHRVDGEIRCPECFQKQQPKGEQNNMTTTNETTSTNGTAHSDETIGRKKFRQRLRCKLTQDEKLERLQRAAELEADIESREEDLDATKKLKKAEIEKIEAARRQLVTESRFGLVEREVPCERRFDYRLGRVLEVRLDTGEVTFERPMTGDERQPTLPIPGVAAAAEDDGELEEGGQPGHDADEGDLEDGEDDGEPASDGPTNWTPDETDEPTEMETEDEASARTVREEMDAAGVPRLEEPDLGPEPVLETAKGKGRKSKKSKAAANSEGAE